MKGKLLHSEASSLSRSARDIDEPEYLSGIMVSVLTLLSTVHVSKKAAFEQSAYPTCREPMA
jgi:hypothetical protein